MKQDTQTEMLWINVIFNKGVVIILVLVGCRFIYGLNERTALGAGEV